MKWVEIFKTGTHTDGKNGRTRPWTEQDLDKIVSNYNSAEHEAPIVLGHPKTNAPAYGWVDKLKRDGEKLLCTFKEVAPEFQEWVNNGLYKKRSISVYPDGSLRHVGFLGAKPPAVKGLADFTFNEENESETYEFMDYSTANRISSIGDIFQRLRDFLIDKYDLETAGKLLSQYTIDYLKESKADDTTQDSLSAYCEKIMEELEVGKENPQIKKQQESSDFADELKAKDTKIAELEAEKTKLESEKRKTEYSSFCENLKKEGKLTPAQEKLAIDFLEMANGVGTFDFSEGNENNPVEKMKEFFNMMPKQISFGEFASKNSDSAYTFAEGDEEMALADKIANSLT